MTSRHPAVSCACPKCQSERRTPPPPATEEREALGATVSAFWDTKDTVESCINAVLSALAPYRAAEILAAEARGAERDRASGAFRLYADTEADAVAGLRYIEQRYGRLDGVAWDRVFDAHDRLFAMGSNEHGSGK